jgi:hypothetical protein
MYLVCVSSWSFAKAQKVALEGALGSTHTSHPPMQLSTHYASLALRRPTRSLTGTPQPAVTETQKGCPAAAPHWPLSVLLSPQSLREKLLQYLYSLKQPDGSFLMHVGGEVDVRWVGFSSGSCSVVSRAYLLLAMPDLRCNMAKLFLCPIEMCRMTCQWQCHGHWTYGTDVLRHRDLVTSLL